MVRQKFVEISNDWKIKDKTKRRRGARENDLGGTEEKST